MKNHNQQPEVIACQGGGERADEGVNSVIVIPSMKSASSGYSESGTSEEYPPADTLKEEVEMKMLICLVMVAIGILGVLVPYNLGISQVGVMEMHEIVSLMMVGVGLSGILLLLLK